MVRKPDICREKVSRETPVENHTAGRALVKFFPCPALFGKGPPVKKLLIKYRAAGIFP